MEWKFSKKQLLPPVLSGSTLKWIAIVTMLIDHIGAVLFENGFIKAYNQQLSGAFLILSLMQSGMQTSG